MVFNYSPANRKMSWKYVSLANIEKKIPDAMVATRSEQVLKVWQNSDSHRINVQLQSKMDDETQIWIYSVNGRLCQTLKTKSNEINSVNVKESGIYFTKASVGNTLFVSKIVVQ